MMDLCKSQIDFYVVLVEKLFLDLSLRYPLARKSFTQDAKVVRLRVASEGLSFLTKTLPKLGKWFDRWIAGHSDSFPTEFRKSHGNRTIPAFLQGLFSLCTGPAGFQCPSDWHVIRDIRQILFFAYKLELPYAKRQEESVIDNFEATDREIRAQAFHADSSLLSEGRRLAQLVLKGFDPKDIQPRHGPGAVASGEKGNRKWNFSTLYNSIHQSYPYYDYFVAGGSSELRDRKQWYLSLSRKQSGCAKVVLVPKDSRGPRLISCEPLEYQYIQQGIGRKLVKHLESHRLTKGVINFTHQTVNQNLAYSSSIDGLFATLDLKDASDRVSLELVRALIPEDIFKCLEASRTTRTLLPDGREVELAKFAPMGSALCFPVEAFVFWLICVVSIRSASRLPLSFVAPRCFVYGDDIIVPRIYAEVVIDALESVGLMVNKQKCFISGPFRESCGVDAYKGNFVTPLRLRKLWNEKPFDGSVYASYVALSNELAKRDYTEACTFLRGMLRQVFGVIPWGVDTASYPCFRASSYWDAHSKNCELGVPMRWNSDIQRSEFFVKTLQVKKIDDPLDGWPRLLKALLVPTEGDPTKVAQTRSAQLRARWRVF